VPVRVELGIDQVLAAIGRAEGHPATADRLAVVKDLAGNLPPAAPAPDRRQEKQQEPGAAGGFHTCEFCGQAHGVGNFGVPSGDLLFVAPEMAVHYIEKHGYSPPAEFVEAVLRSSLLDTEESQLIADPFWHRHREIIERMM
jgi:hypothetical protein